MIYKGNAVLENTPQVKWSNAWWSKILLGLVVPAGLLIVLVYCITADTAFVPTVQGYRRIGIQPVSGLQATLMMIVYACLAVASFAYGYARHHERLGYFYDKVLAIALLGAGVCTVWCSILLLP